MTYNLVAWDAEGQIIEKLPLSRVRDTQLYLGSLLIRHEDVVKVTRIRTGFMPNDMRAPVHVLFHA